VAVAWRDGDERDGEFVAVRQQVWGSLARDQLAHDLAWRLVTEVFEDRCAPARLSGAAAGLAVAA
jgi:hypothetical protein